MDPGAMLERVNSEGFLAFSVQDRVGADRYYHYSDMSENEVDAGKVPVDPFCADQICHRHMHPFNHDSARGLLHASDWEVKRRVMQEAYSDRFAPLAPHWDSR